MTTTPQLVEKPKARLKAGLRRVALRPDQLAEEFLAAWPEHDHPDIPTEYFEQENDFASERFWEDIDEGWGSYDADWLISQYTSEDTNKYAELFVNSIETLLYRETDDDTKEGPWYPIIDDLINWHYDLHELTDEPWYNKWVNEIIPAHNDSYMNLLAYHIAEIEEVEQWLDMEFSPPGIGGEVQGEGDIVVAKRTADLDVEDVAEQRELGRAFLKSDQFRNWFKISSSGESELPDNFTFADIIKTVVEHGVILPDDLLEDVMEDAVDACDVTGLDISLDDLYPIDYRIRMYVEMYDEIDKDKLKEVISEDYGSTVEELIGEELKFLAHNRFRYNLSEELELETGEDSPYPDIANQIAERLADQSLTPEDLVEHKGLFGSGGHSSSDFEEVYDLLESWSIEIDDGTIHFDDEDYARAEQAEREHKFWMEQRRNRTPQGNVYDVGDQVMYNDWGPLTVSKIRQVNSYWRYSLQDADGLFVGEVGEQEIRPAPPPQQEMFPDTTTASILDEPAETLDPFIFDISKDQTAPKIHDDVREKVLEQLGKARVNPDAIRAVIFFGSSAAYQYDPDSDFDITVVVDPSLTRQGEEILGLNREISDELFIAGHPVTYFFREDEYPIEGSDAIYDMIGNFWIRVPERSESALEKPEYDDTIADAKEWAEILDVQIGELRRDVIDYEKLSGAYQRASESRKQELYDKVQAVISDLNESVAALAHESDQLHETRLKAFQEDLEENGEDVAERYLSRNWIPENVLYKVLERYRYTKLLKMMDKLNKEGLFDDQNQLKLEYAPPIKSAMEKPEDEIEPGDHMQDHRNHDVIVEDVHDAGEGYQYEMYKTYDDKGKTDEVEKLELIMVDDNPERLLPKTNPEMKTAAAGGTGYGDYQEKITDSSGSSMAGDVSGSHEPDIYPMDPDNREGSPVPSKEYEKSKEKAKEIRHRNSVAMRSVNAIATEVVGTIRMGMYRIQKKRKAQVDQNSSGDQYAAQKPGMNPGPYQPQNVAGQPLGGGYSTNETQQAEQPTGEASEEENLSATQQNYDATQQGKELSEEMQANDMTQQYQLRMMGASVEERKLQLIMGSSVGAETPADSSVGQLESSEDNRLRSKTDETRKVLLHEKDEDDKGDNATFPKLDDQLKPLP